MNTRQKIVSAYFLLVCVLCGGALWYWYGPSVPVSSSAPYEMPSNGSFDVSALERRIAQLEAQQSVLMSRTEGKDTSIVETVEQVKKGVVSIIATKELAVYRNNSFSNPFFNDPFFREFFDIPEQTFESEKKQVEVGGGSGFIISEDGFIMTNKHVVKDESAAYSVVLLDGTELPAQVVARDMFNDIAVVKVDLSSVKDRVTILSFGNSDAVSVGDRVIAIGNALARFQNTVTQGIISGLQRQISASNGRSDTENIRNLLQTDAAINPGNSGGPLVNLAGEVIGMNTAIVEGANGIGFAIPAADLRYVSESIAQFGTLRYPFIGVRYVMLSDVLQEKYGVSRNEGALVTSGDESLPAVLENSPAQKAGLREGDIIVAIDGETLSHEKGIREILMQKFPGDTVRLQVVRNGQEQSMVITLESMDE